MRRTVCGSRLRAAARVERDGERLSRGAWEFERELAARVPTCARVYAFATVRGRAVSVDRRRQREEDP